MDAMKGEMVVKSQKKRCQVGDQSRRFSDVKGDISMVDFYGKLVGKYTIHGCYGITLTPQSW